PGGEGRTPGGGSRGRRRRRGRGPSGAPAPGGGGGGGPRRRRHGGPLPRGREVLLTRGPLQSGRSVARRSTPRPLVIKRSFAFPSSRRVHGVKPPSPTSVSS